MSVTALVVTMCCIVPPAVAWAIHAGSKARAAADSAWSTAAERLGGQFTPIGGPWYRRTPRRIDAVIDGVAVALDHYEVSSGENSSTTYTRARSPARAPADFTLKVYRASALSGLARAIGFQDVEVGDPGFDEAYVVKSSDPVAARMWLNASVRDAILGAWEFAFEIKGGTTESTRGKLLGEPEELVSLARAVVAVSDGRGRVLKAWRSVATAHDGSVTPHPERWATMAVVFDGVPMRADTRKVGDDHYTYVTAAVRGGRAKPFVLARDATLHKSKLPLASGADLPPDYLLWADDPDAVLTRLGPAVREGIATLSPAMIRVGEDNGTVTWAGICVSREEMEDAMRLCALVTSGEASGPYR